MVNGETTVLDLKGLKCPLPVLRTRKALSGLNAGARIWIETTDPLAVIDIPSFCQQNGHRLVDTAAQESGHRFLIERGQDQAR
ncbi:MAG: sulfurtransferase TusA family protein [Rhizobiaceae bacterium]